MSVAYVDSSVMLAIAFREPGWEVLPALLGEFSRVCSSNLLESEVRAGYARYGIPFDADILSSIEWIFPERRLSEEIERAASVRYLRGADLHHVATALYIADSPEDMAFVTLDREQEKAAAALGFQTALQT